MSQSKLQSPLKWMGGKFRLARKIIAFMPKHNCYCEPFCGACHVLFKKEPAKVEIINDIDGELMFFWRQVKADITRMEIEHNWSLASRREFYRLRNMELAQVQKLEPGERAYRYFYLNRLCFAGKMRKDANGTLNPSFVVNAGTDTSCRSVLAWRNSIERIREVHKRLEKVTIENLDFEYCIKLYDRPTTLFYVDPPYHGAENIYGIGRFCEADHKRLAQRLAKIEGKFILSINDTELTRKVYGQFKKLAEIDFAYPRHGAESRSGERMKKTTEMLYANFDVPGLI